MEPTLVLACVTRDASNEVLPWLGSFGLVSAIVTAILASHRGRSALGWFFIGGFVQWVSLVILYCLDDLSVDPDEPPEVEGSQAAPPPGAPLAQADGRWPSTSDAALALPQDGWFYSLRRHPMGPVSLQYLRGAIEMGSLDKNVPVWCGAFRDWVTPGRVPGFFG